MKVKVLRKFKDRHTGEIYKAGKELEVTAERLAEIEAVSKDFVAVVESDEAPEETKEEKPKKAKKAKKAE